MDDMRLRYRVHRCTVYIIWAVVREAGKEEIDVDVDVDVIFDDDGILILQCNVAFFKN